MFQVFPLAFSYTYIYIPWISRCGLICPGPAAVIYDARLRERKGRSNARIAYDILAIDYPAWRLSPFAESSAVRSSAALIDVNARRVSSRHTIRFNFRSQSVASRDSVNAPSAGQPGGQPRYGPQVMSVLCLCASSIHQSARSVTQTGKILPSPPSDALCEQRVTPSQEIPTDELALLAKLEEANR